MAIREYSVTDFESNQDSWGIAMSKAKMIETRPSEAGREEEYDIERDVLKQLLNHNKLRYILETWNKTGMNNC